MSSKILRRLILYFVATFAVFAIIIGVIFTALFFRRNLNTHREEFTRRAIIVAESLSEMIVTGDYEHDWCLCEASHYLGLIAGITMSDVRVVDRYFGDIVFGCRHRRAQRMNLLADTSHIVESAFMGNTALCHRSFTMYLDNPYVTVATPIILQDGEIIGVLLMHTHVESINEVTRSGIMLLVYSMIAGVVVSVAVAIMLSSRFTLPLSKMKAAALKISDGDYTGRTGVAQQDEIGELALIMDSMATKLEIAANESQKLEKLRRDFIANISHELRTPITVIRGSLEALCDGVVSKPNKVKEYHDKMLWECKYLGRLVSDLLDLSRLQNIDFDIEMQPVCMQQVLDDVLMSMAGLAKQKDVKLEFGTAQSDCKITGDYDRLRQMFIILIDNAIKFSPEGGTVLLSLSYEGDVMYITVTDQGPGVPEHDISHIFERFYKERSEHNKAGVGLGLAIAKEITERHGASLRVKNNLCGAEFQFVVHAGVG